ncbi:MAG: L,D-transpeptidase [Gammaproteobacteria bacterium]|nr:L,D-transpeptidase [Gammaproteobacteria bacterium]
MVAIVIAAFVIFFCLINPVFAKRITTELCDNPKYFCYVVKRGDTWQKLFKEPEQVNLVMRINRMNTRLHKGMTIAIPKTISNDPLLYSPLPNDIDPPGEKVIIVSLGQLAFGAYGANGRLEYWGPISGGKSYCADVRSRCSTPPGRYRIYTKQGSGCFSTKFPVGKGGAPMPYCMFFKGGFALHGSPTVPGYHDSHGCVRLFTNDAKWLNQEFDDGHTRVIVKP